MPKRKRPVENEETRGFAGVDPQEQAPPVSAFAAARARQLREPEQAHLPSQGQDAHNERNLSGSDAKNISTPRVSPAELLEIAGDNSDGELDSISELSDEASSSEDGGQVWELTTWQPAEDRSNIVPSSSSSVTLSFKKPETLAYLGYYRLRVRKGVISVYGARLRPNDSVEIYAPATHPIPIIYPVSEQGELEVSVFPDSISLIRHISPLFKRIWNVVDRKQTLSDGEIETASLVRDTDSDRTGRPLRPLLFPSEWQACLDDMSTSDRPNIVLVDGTAGSARSTYCSVIINSFLSRADFRQKSIVPTVYLLDMDQGQPHSGPPGLVSLVQILSATFGPSYCRPTFESVTGMKVVRMVPMPVRCKEDYLSYYHKAVLELLDHYDSQKLHPTANLLVVNPPSWACHTASSFGRFETILSCFQNTARRIGGEFRRLPCPTYYKSSLRTEKEFHTMQLLSLFHQTSPKNSRPMWNPLPLSFRSPVLVKYSSVPMQGFSGVLKIGNWVSPNYLYTVLNGNLVSIVTTSDPDFADQYGKLPSAGASGIPYFPPNENGAVRLPEPSATQFYSPAIVANIDSVASNLQLLVPPLFQHGLQTLEPRNIILVLGFFETPEWCYTEDAYYDEFETQKAERTQNGLDDRVDVNLEIKETVKTLNGSERDERQQWVMTAKSMEKFADLNLKRKVRGHT